MISRLKKKLLIVSALVPLIAAPSAYADELPTGGQITGGSGSISQSGNTMTVQQNTGRMIANWTSFNIGAGSHVKFVQPSSSSVALNRISGGASQILGRLSANGQVRLINPNGIIFGPNAQVNVGGLVASSLNQSDTDFMNGIDRFSGTDTGAVINKGTITVPAGGSVALIAHKVSNEGTINAAGGSVALAAGEKVTLDFAGDGLINASVDKAAFDAQVDNKGVIVADGGVAIMSAKSTNALMNAVVNNDGIIRANTLSNKNGRIILGGDDQNAVDIGGTIEAKGTQSGETGGEIIITSNKVNLKDGAVIDASGTSGGGKINIGGGWQGGDPEIAHAMEINSEAGTTLRANATDNGNGGEVVLWSDGTTNANGTIEAKGGTHGGNGGRIETSGHTLNIGKDLSISTAAPASKDGYKGGLWLIDPTYSFIDATAASAIVTALSSGDVVNSSTGTTEIDADIISGAGNALSFWSVGQILVNNITISTGGGNLYFGGSSGGNSYATGQANGETGIVLDGSTLNAGTGTITINGEGYTPGDLSVLASSVSSNEDAGIGVLFSGAVSLTGSDITISGQGGQGQYVVNETNVQSTVTCDGDFSCAAQPANNGASVSGGDGEIGINIASGANVTMTATNEITINAIAGDGGDGEFLHHSSGGDSAYGGDSATGYVQEGDLTIDAPTATINAEGSYDGEGYGDGYWYQYYDQEYGNVCDVNGCTWQVTAEGNKLDFEGNYYWSDAAAYGMYITGNLTNSNGAGSVTNLISNYDAYQGGILTASHVMMRGDDDSTFTFKNASNTLDRIAGEYIDTLYLNHNYDTNDQSLHIGTVSGVAGITDTEEIYIRVTSTGNTGSSPALIQDSGAVISFDDFASLMADTMQFNGADNSISTTNSGNIALRPYTASQEIVIASADPNQGNNLYIPDSDLTVFDSSLDYLLLGGDEGTGNITISADADFNQNLSLANGNADITITGDISVPSGKTLTLRSNGIVDVSGAVSATHLALHGDGGSFTFSNTDNEIEYLSTSDDTNAELVDLVNTGDLEIENEYTYGVDSSESWDNYSIDNLYGDGVRADDRVYINTTGDMTLNAPVYGLGTYTGSTNYSTADNLNEQQAAAVLLVAGDDFRNYEGSSAISTAGSNRFLVYSDTPNTWADQSTNFDFKMYAWNFYDAGETSNGNNGYDFDIGGFGRDLPDSTVGDGFLYKHQPTLTITALDQDGTYGDAPSLSSTYGVGFEADGYIDGDSDSNNTGTAAFTTTATSASNVGTYDIDYTEAASGGLTGIVPKYNNIVLGYIVVNDTAANAYTINQRPITITANSGQSMVYGDSVPTLAYTVTSGTLANTGSTGALSGALSTDATSTSDVDNTYTISQGTLDNSNYDITYVDDSFEVTARPVTISPKTGQKKTVGQNDPKFQYTVSYTGNGSKPGLVNSDTSTGELTRTSGELVGDYTFQQGTVVINDGNSGGNYDITFSDSNKFKIEQSISTSSFTSTQTGITGTSQSTTNTTVTSSVGPGTGSSTMTASANTPLVTNNTAPSSSSSTNDTSSTTNTSTASTGTTGTSSSTPPTTTPQVITVSFSGSTSPVTISRTGGTVSLTIGPASGTNTAQGSSAIKLPEGLPLLVSGKTEVQNYSIASGGNKISATFTGAAAGAPPANFTFSTPPVKTSLAQSGGANIDITVRISSSGVLVVEAPADAVGNLDPQTTMLIALAVARENFGADVDGIKSVFITPPVEQ